MVKDVVKFESRMIDMWSYFQVVDTLQNHSTGSEEVQENREQIRIANMSNTPTAICGQLRRKR